MWEPIGCLGAVPRRLTWDNETGIGRWNSDAAADIFPLAIIRETRE